MSTHPARRCEWGLLAFYGAVPLVCSVAGAVVVGAIAVKSRFGTQFGGMATDSLQHGIVFSLSAALGVGGAVLALVWRRLLWLAGLSLAFAAVIFCPLLRSRVHVEEGRHLRPALFVSRSAALAAVARTLSRIRQAQ